LNPAAKFAAILIIVLFFLEGAISTTFAQLCLPQIFGNGMVLQRNHVIPIWGKACPENTVTVSLAGFIRSVNADAEGNWQVKFPSMEAGGPYIMTVSTGSQQQTRTDIYIGDVWLASGQSNMEFPVCALKESASIRTTANDQKIRQFKVHEGLANNPSDELPLVSTWTPATTCYVWNFTAVGYYFAYYLRQNYDIPIGIINTSYSGSRIEAWMSNNMLGPDVARIKTPDDTPQHQPTVVFNKMLYPLTKYPIKGIIWYQGESNINNVTDALDYGNLFKTMINGWRSLWNDGDIPFLWVQLPGYGHVYDQPQTLNVWPQLRAEQTSALSLPNTGEAVTIDIGAVDIHPPDKQDVGYRLSLIARKIAYGENIVSSGPRYVNNFLRADGKIEIDFTDVGGGLKAKDTQGGRVNGFAIADKNNNLVWANAVIEGNKVIVWNDAVTKWNNAISNPEIVRYAWEYNPATANLYNAEDLPAAPFMAKVNRGLRIMFFRLGSKTPQIGESTTLSWRVYGATTVSLNGIQVDTSSTIKIQLEKTNIYRLIAENRYNASEKDTALINVVIPTSEFILKQNYPNPCNPQTTINYSLPEDGKVQIKVFDALGRKIVTLLDDFVGSGNHSIDWNGGDSASGMYFYSLTFKGQTLYKKMLLLK